MICVACGCRPSELNKNNAVGVCLSHCESLFDGPFTEQRIHVFLESWFGAVGRHRVNKDVGEKGRSAR